MSPILQTVCAQSAMRRTASYETLEKMQNDPEGHL